MAARTKKLGELLVEKELINEQELANAIAKQKQTGHRLGMILVAEHYITEDDLLQVISERLGIPKMGLDNLHIDTHVIDQVPVDVAKRFQLVPVFKIGNTLTVAMVDPLDVIALDKLKYHTKCNINRVLASSAEIAEAIENYYSVKDSVREAIAAAEKKEAAATAAVETQRVESVEEPIVKLVDLILQQAVKERASDIHIEPDFDILRVRYRVNGILKQVDTPPKRLQQSIISRLKVMADLDLSEKRIPQDGRITMQDEKYSVDLRISTLPTVLGEKVVIRILDRTNLDKTVEDYGMCGTVLEHWNQLITKPEGLILVTGPTGSGKTSTLYAALQSINTIEKNIVTVEDPVEYNLELINQVQVNEKANLTFAAALRSILRQNPDIIMVGEIRDSETAAMAIRSALTGHLVLSTLHTNDSSGAIPRLMDLEVERYFVASALQGVIAQRLLRTICPNCKSWHKLSDREQNELRLPPGNESPEFYSGDGCPNCNNTGYDGRIGAFEILPVTEKIRDMIYTGRPANEMKAEAISAGGSTLYDSALEKALAGITTPQEVIRVSYAGDPATAEKEEATA